MSVTRTSIDPMLWTSGSWEGQSLAAILARRDIAAIFGFLHARGYSYSVLGSLSGLTPARIGEIAKGTRQVTAYDVLERIAIGLSIPRAAMGLGQRPHDSRPVASADCHPSAGRGEIDPAASIDDPDVVDGRTTLHGIREALDEALASSTVSPRHMDLVEQSVAEHMLVYPATAPITMLSRLAVECGEVQRLSQRRQPAATQARLSAAAALLATMCADALMRLGVVEQARLWYRTAVVAADDSADPRLRVLVRAQAAMLPYYFGHPGRTVSLAEEAMTLPATICPSTALAAAAKARALARQGADDEAKSAANAARRLFDQVGDVDSDEAFRFPAKRLLLYLSGAATWLGDTATAYRVQEEALSLYRSSAPSLVDPALLRLDRAACLVSDHRVAEAAALVREAIDGLPATQRTELVLTRADTVVEAVPAAQRARVVTQTVDYLRVCRERTRTLRGGPVMIDR